MDPSLELFWEEAD